MRHSRLVRVSRIAVPAAFAAVIAVLALAAWFNPLRLLGELPVGLRDIVISGTKIKMEQPRLSGFTRDARPYDLSARSAAQDIAKPELIELIELRAKIQMHDRSQVDVSAATGLFNTKAEVLTLEDNILVKSSTGYEGRLSQAVINTRTGDIVSEKPVALKMLNGTVNANAMEIEQAGEVVRFNGGVAMQLMPNKDQGSVPGQVPQQ
ncbi:MAG: LPS export ABC transporter periplasmic protein LptC [Rhizobiales bacterium]|nr:LPS export ABC transporter periplasmic protein LptC [Hyphomicrobiales bacterium]